MAGLEGKVALITGASRGIGAATARRLATDGATVLVNYATSREEAEDVAAGINASGGRAIVIQGDVSDLASIKDMYRRIAAETDRIDILVNNAGRSAAGYPRILDVTPEVFDAVYNLNVRGLFFTTQGAVAMMPDGARIIMISSIASLIRSPGMAVYGASKSAVNGFTRNLAAELGPRGITVNSINCGAIATAMSARVDPAVIDAVIARTPLGRIGRPEDIANMVAMLAGDEGEWITGEEIAVSGGCYA